MAHYDSVRAFGGIALGASMEDVDEDDSGPVISSRSQLKDPSEYDRYRGKVIAVIDGEVRASADTWSECGRALQKAGIDPESACFTKVPPKNFIGGGNLRRVWPSDHSSPKVTRER